MKRRTRSALALDAAHLCAADMRDGVGPYLTLFLLNQPTWNAPRIGWALAAASLASLVFTGPAGLMLDRTRHRRLVMVLASGAVAIGVFALTLRPAFWAVLFWQTWIGLAGAFIGPGLVALSVGVSGEERLANRIARNETFNHSGNFVAALISNFLARAYAVVAVFYLVIVMCGLNALSVFNVGGVAARGRSPGDRARAAKNSLPPREILWFLILVFTFQLANAAQLPLVAQLVEQRAAGFGVRLLGPGLIIAQLTAIPVAWGVGWLCRKFSAWFAFRLGLIAVIARALIFAGGEQLLALQAAQILDGIAAGVLAVAPILILFDYAKASGRFTAASGVLASAVALGASLSQVLGGYAFQHLGGPPCFVLLGGCAFASLLLSYV